MDSEIKNIREQIFEIFLDEKLNQLAIENVFGNELFQRLMDAVTEFEVKYEAR